MSSDCNTDSTEMVELLKTKYCIKCGEYHPLTEDFWYFSAGHKVQCKYQQLLYRKKNADKNAAYWVEYRKKHRKEKQEKHKKRLSQDIDYKIACELRHRMTQAVRSNAKWGSAVQNLGCSISSFREYIEALFQTGMSWNNWGRGDKGRGYEFWHLDHIIPLALFDLTDEAQFLKACHYTNLQPLWAADNYKKPKLSKKRLKISAEMPIRH